MTSFYIRYELKVAGRRSNGSMETKWIINSGLPLRAFLTRLEVEFGLHVLLSFEVECQSGLAAERIAQKLVSQFLRQRQPLIS